MILLVAIISQFILTRSRSSFGHPEAAMSRETPEKPQRLLGYPPLASVQHGCALVVADPPDIVYRTVSVKLHSIKEREAALLLAVFRNNILAAEWMLRDIEKRRSLKRFAKYRQRDRTSYYTRGIADEI